MKTMLFLLAFSIFTASAQTEDKLQELTKRIEELERQHNDLLLQGQGDTKVNSFLRDNLTLGGFLDTGIVAMEGPDTNLQVLNNTNIIGLNIAAEYSDRIRFVSQLLSGLQYPLLNPHNNPGANPPERKHGSFIFGAVLTQGYVEYTFSNALRLQGGLGYSPFGIALQQRELVLFQRRGGPQVLRTQRLVAALWNGLHLLGNMPISGGGEWGYNLYTTNPIDTNESRILGVGGRLWIANSEETVQAGLSSQYGKYRAGTDSVVGTDLQWRAGSFKVLTEYVRHVADRKDPWSAYIEPSFTFKNEAWSVFAFGDYAESPLATYRAGLGEVSDAHKKWEYGAGVNWLPSVYTRIRFTLTKHDYVGGTATLNGQNRDYHSADVSIGVAF